jgi:toxin-antitoxin system PIN domain toxin
VILLDVNVLVYAHRADSPEHPTFREFLDELLNGGSAFGVPEMVLSSVVRIATQSFQKPPSTTKDALEFCLSVRSSPKCHVLFPSPAHWSIFDRLCRAINAKGNLVADAYLAAFAIDRGDTWVTADADFGKFPGLTWRHPLKRQSVTNPR